MGEFDPDELAEAVGRIAVTGDASPGGVAARAIRARLDANRGNVREAARGAFVELLEAMSQSYFGQEWAAEHEFSTWARLTDDRRAWGYGSEEELAPIRWLVERTGCWFDGRELVAVDQWRPRFEEWAETQAALVRRMTPGALENNAFERGSVPGSAAP